ncbi:hypothetical protein AB0F52_14400 [Amycolatopsis sp. NPDC024027]|uniref:hypothetical protein n=1 Tax=Amycolatopsis sp. NPDC024027 TaxID=3154327 RepID=UPI0033C17DF2
MKWPRPPSTGDRSPVTSARNGRTGKPTERSGADVETRSAAVQTAAAVVVPAIKRAAGTCSGGLTVRREGAGWPIRFTATVTWPRVRPRDTGSAAPAFDLDGSPRPAGAAYDIGACERC